VKEGYRIPLCKEVKPNKPLQYSLDRKNKELIDKEVKNLLEKKAIKKIDIGLTDSFYSPLFTVPKKNGKHRPVLNLKALNLHLPKIRFKMETFQKMCTIIKRKDYLTSVDLSDAFLHVPVHPTSQRLLRFEWSDQHYQFLVLPFGLALSPLVFTKVLKVALKHLRKKKIRISAYLDDLIIAAKNKEESQKHTRIVIETLSTLGFKINKDKSNLTPSQSIEHLGFRIKTRSMTASLPGTKIRDLRREAQKLLTASKVSRRQIAGFIGRAIAATPAVLPARLFTRALTRLLNNHGHLQWDQQQILVNEETITETKWWVDRLKKWDGKSFLNAIPDVEIYSDASDLGWGIVSPERTLKGSWNTTDRLKHINWKELMTVWILVKQKKWQGRTILLHCDNKTVVAYLNKFGGTVSPELSKLAEKIWHHCLTTGTCLMARYVPTTENLADQPSRALQSATEWTISDDAFNKIQMTWGPHTMDLFATAHSTKLRDFVNYQKGEDATKIPWKPFNNPYACPPWPLAAKTIQKCILERKKMTIILPWWEGAIWFPALKTILVERLELSYTDVIPATETGIHPLRNTKWSLCACRVNGNLWRKSASSTQQST